MINSSKTLLLMTVFFLLASCGEEEIIPDEFDNNNDGIFDVTTEYSYDGFYEFRDRNFDEKVDRVTFYLNSGLAAFSRFDNDFNGFVETTVLMNLGLADEVFIDSNNDDKIDLYFKYENGVLKYSEHYIKKSKMLLLTKSRYHLNVVISEETIQVTEEKLKLLEDKYEAVMILINSYSN